MEITIEYYITAFMNSNITVYEGYYEFYEREKPVEIRVTIQAGTKEQRRRETKRTK